MASSAGGQFLQWKPQTGNESKMKEKEQCFKILEQILHLQKVGIKITGFGSCELNNDWYYTIIIDKSLVMYSF